MGVLEKSIFDYINGHPKQYILVDTIFNYIFHFGRSRKMSLDKFLQKVCFEDLNNRSHGHGGAHCSRSVGKGCLGLSTWGGAASPRIGDT